MSDSSSSDIEELGINLQEFRMKRQVRFGSRKTITSTKKDIDLLDTPPELDYYNLLNKGIAILKKDKENGETNKLKLPLDVKKEGRKTKVNIREIAEILDRDEEHLVKFTKNELVTDGSVQEDGYLWLKGIYLKTDLQEVLRKFIENFVVCSICDSVEDTSIIKDKRLYYLKCDKCGGRRCVGNITEGLSKKSNTKPKLRGII